MSAIPAAISGASFKPFWIARSTPSRDDSNLSRPDERGFLARLDARSFGQCSVARGELLIREGDRFESLYQIRAGQFKTCHSDQSGHDQVTGFQMSDELLGLDGIASGRHCFRAVALEDSVVGRIHYAELSARLSESADLQREFHRTLSREIVRDQAMMLLLGTMPAQGRVAAFLLDLTHKLRARGWSASSLLLRMSRDEMGSYLGQTLETVSRALSSLQSKGVMAINRRQVHVLDAPNLDRIAHCGG